MPMPPGKDHEGLRHPHEVVQAREERPVRRDAVEVRVRLLVRNRDRQAEGARLARAARGRRALVGRLHRPGPPPVTMSQPSSVSREASSPDVAVFLVLGLQPRASEDGDAVEVELRRVQGLELLDRVPEAHDRAVDDLADVRLAPDLLASALMDGSPRVPGASRLAACSGESLLRCPQRRREGPRERARPPVTAQTV